LKKEEDMSNEFLSVFKTEEVTINCVASNYKFPKGSNSKLRSTKFQIAQHQIAEGIKS
jgi:hypothetical protein